MCVCLCVCVSIPSERSTISGKVQSNLNCPAGPLLISPGELKKIRVARVPVNPFPSPTIHSFTSTDSFRRPFGRGTTDGGGGGGGIKEDEEGGGTRIEGNNKGDNADDEEDNG